MQAVAGNNLPNTVTPFVAASRPVAPKLESASQAISINPVEQAGVVVSLANNLKSSTSALVYQRPSAPDLSAQPAAPAGNAPPPEVSPVGPPGSDTGGDASDSAPAERNATNAQPGSEDGSAPEVRVPPVGSSTNNEDESDAVPEAPQSEPPVANRSRSERSEEENGAGLTPEEQALVSELSARDREVRTHELQHQAVGGQHAGAARFSYQTGPDGVQYAVGGEVSISVSEVPNDPRATIEKMRTVRAAALAPAEPSAQDRSVAAQASRLMLKAQAELTIQAEEERAASAAQQAERREAIQQEEESARDSRAENQQASNSNIRTYESFIQLGQQYENGLQPEPNLLDVVV